MADKAKFHPPEFKAPTLQVVQQMNIKVMNATSGLGFNSKKA